MAAKTIKLPPEASQRKLRASLCNRIMDAVATFDAGQPDQARRRLLDLVNELGQSIPVKQMPHLMTG